MVKNGYTILQNIVSKLLLNEHNAEGLSVCEALTLDTA